MRLTFDGTEVTFPDFRTNRLWLKDHSSEAVSAEDRLELQVYRRVEDMVPMQMITRMEIDVAGRQREVVIGPVLPVQSEGELFIPVKLTSPITARLENDGSLRLQVRPGHWVVEVAARSTGAVEVLPVPEVKAP
ncbi:MAG: hypothetical protein RRA15_03380 [bacterium]|nr:hypothetical protein [bacterium]MDT8365516.1 hypothetical protein [bacterium]